MDFNGADNNNEFSVNEGAFWHTNMDLYYGYQIGEVVEVEHESDKYWLATIKYSFKHLLLLKWVGSYGEFWVDTSMQNLTNATGFDELNGPRRIFQPGYHSQSQLKSQFTLERPTRVLVKPSLYNPANDPYAEIKTVEDLLTHEIEDQGNDACESVGLVLGKCKTKISYGQEDVDELEAALQNLTEINSDRVGDESSYNFNPTNEISTKTQIKEEKPVESEVISEEPIKQNSEKVKNESDTGISEEPSSNLGTETSQISQILSNEKKIDSEAAYHAATMETCKSLQESAICKGRYVGIEENSHKVYYLKPKQFFDVGGANHERVLVPGTLLEICHSIESDEGLGLYRWFAIVLKNVGGRLTLRWFLCDEPKFKQGRLELKSCHSEYIREDSDSADEEDGGSSNSNNEEKGDLSTKTNIPVRNITFSMHFCNPSVHSIHSTRSTNRTYRMPTIMRSTFEDLADSIEQAQIDLIFDYRRMNLDKDRPIIDHLFSTVRWTMPKYLNLSFAPKDNHSRREILFSTPRTTKLLRGYVKRELEAGVFEIHSEPLTESGEIIKFIYPHDSSFAILPTSWADNNQDCLSVHPSRNQTPTLTGTSLPNEGTDAPSKGVDEVDFVESNVKHGDDSGTSNSYDPVDVGPYTLMCEIPKSNTVEIDEGSSDTHTRPEDFDDQEPSCWSRFIRAHELKTPQFHCSIDYKNEISSTNFLHDKFKVMDQLEVVHPSSDATLCLGRIRKVVYPLLWIQISADSYTLLPFNSTDIYPSGWCETNNYPLVSLLPPRKRLIQDSHQADKKRKRAKNSDDAESEPKSEGQKIEYEKEHFDLGALNDKQLDIDYILNEKTTYIRIYFNHKCFTGPSLSKGKICSLPQYVGPGPLRLVMEEVVTKVISVAYVPPRILNDLSSKSFEDLLIARNLTNTVPMEFKAKYQKRVHREEIQVCISPDDVALYCECVCEHLKCCYNLFGPNLYDGDDCPGHCRALTKSNKFMKRATYYREKARLGEFLTNDSNNGKKSNNSSNKLTSRARYTGRDSSESNSSSISRSEPLNSRASSAGDDPPMNDLKENLVAVEEIDDESEEIKNEIKDLKKDENEDMKDEIQEIKDEFKDIKDEIKDIKDEFKEIKDEFGEVKDDESDEIKDGDGISQLFTFMPRSCVDFRPENWTIDDVAEQLEWCRLGKFRPHMVSEGVDGQALLLLDKVAIREHFQQHQPKSEYTPDEVSEFCRFVEFVKARSRHTSNVQS